MPTCPNCGSIVMEGDPYCSHCGAHFNWASIDEVDDVPEFGVVSDSGYGEPISYKFYTSKSVPEKPGSFLDFGEVSETYRITGENELEYIAYMVWQHHLKNCN